MKCAVLAGAASLASCASTSQFVSTWKAPDAQSLKGEGSKVAAVVMTPNESRRRSAEDSLAREITRMGANGVAAYTLIQEGPTQDAAQAREALEKAGVSLIVVMHPTVSEEIDSAAAAATYWGGYYGYGWGAACGRPADIHTDTVIRVKTMVYSMKQNKLVWSGQSQTTNAGKLDSMVQDLARAVADEMKKEGLI